MPPNGIRFSRSREAAVGWKGGLGAAPLRLLGAGAGPMPAPALPGYQLRNTSGRYSRSCRNSHTSPPLAEFVVPM